MRSILEKVSKRVKALAGFFTQPATCDNPPTRQVTSVVVRLRMTNYDEAEAINSEQSPDWISDLKDDLVESGAFLSYIDVNSKLLIFEIYDQSVSKHEILEIIERYNIKYEEVAGNAKAGGTGLGYA